MGEKEKPNRRSDFLDRFFPRHRRQASRVLDRPQIGGVERGQKPPKDSTSRT